MLSKVTIILGTPGYSRGFPNAAYQPKLIQMVPINSPPGFKDHIAMTSAIEQPHGINPPKYEDLDTKMTTQL